jgi:hypothetical protein
MFRRLAGMLGLCLAPSNLLVHGQEQLQVDVRVDTTLLAVQPMLEPGFELLFDGQNYDENWEGNKEWFRIENQAIVAGSLEKPIPNNEFLCTKKRYADFDLRLEVMLRGEGKNAGVQFRTERIPNHHEVSGYQADVGFAFKRSVWGALYDESRRKKVLAEGPAESVAKWTKEGEWNDLRVHCSGTNIKIFLNGNPTVDYNEEDKEIARDGIIGLQVHSGPPTEALYRNIRIQPISLPNAKP